MTDDQRLWTKYSERKPETEGAYRWRLQSKYAKGLTVEFVACMRSRWAGYSTQVSPSFARRPARLLIALRPMRLSRDWRFGKPTLSSPH